jgi:hypothetical protein
VVPGLLLLSVISVVVSYPDYISYFNSAVGGPRYGQLYVRDSNLNWDQNDGYLEQYLEDNSNTTADPSLISEFDFYIADVEKLFGNPNTGEQLVIDLGKKIIDEKIEPTEIVHDTHWVFKSEDLL